MITEQQFVDEVVRIARTQGYKIESNARTGDVQVDFGNKKLHAGHFRALLPKLASMSVDIAVVLEEIAPGRPCAHKPMREIVGQMRKEGTI